MGLYCTTTSLQVLMVGTSFDTATTSLADKLIIHAENEINKYLSKRYNIEDFTPAANVPPIVTSLCETLAEGYMYQRMSRGGKDSMARAKELIDMALKNLEAIAKYELDIIDTDGEPIPDMSQTAYRVLSNTTGYANTFNEDSELNWEVDPNKLEDIEDERD